jgi:hypothetical protein
MRYGKPSIASALTALIAAGVDRIVVLPLFPQYASSSTGTALARCGAGERAVPVPALDFIPAFHDDDGFLDAFEPRRGPVLADAKPDHVLFSFHGLPERHVRADRRRPARTAWPRDTAATRLDAGEPRLLPRPVLPHRALARRAPRAGRPTSTRCASSRGSAARRGSSRTPTNCCSTSCRKGVKRSRCCARPSSPIASRPSRRSACARSEQWPGGRRGADAGAVAQRHAAVGRRGRGDGRAPRRSQDAPAGALSGLATVIVTGVSHHQKLSQQLAIHPNSEIKPRYSRKGISCL